jgi:hypothetical protein
MKTIEQKFKNYVGYVCGMSMLAGVMLGQSIIRAIDTNFNLVFVCGLVVTLLCCVLVLTLGTSQIVKRAKTISQKDVRYKKMLKYRKTSKHLGRIRQR